jgi:hypothetical protein
MSSFDEDVDEEKYEVEFQCFFLVLGLPLIMSSFTCLANFTSSSKVHFSILSLKILNLFHNPNQNVSFKNESCAWGGIITLTLVNHL